MPILDKSANPSQINQSRTNLSISQPITNPSIKCRCSTIPPTQTTHTTKPLTFTTLQLSQGINRWHSNHSHWRLIGTRHVNNGPIQCTIPHLVKGTSTIRDRPKCLSGWWFRESILNDVPLKHQSMLPFSQSQTNPMPIHCQSQTNSLPNTSILHQLANWLSIRYHPTRIDHQTHILAQYVNPLPIDCQSSPPLS